MMLMFYIYDSLNVNISTVTQVILAKLVNNNQDVLAIEVSKVNT